MLLMNAPTQAHDGNDMPPATDVKFETMTTKSVRGLEAKTRAKFEQQGWEFVSMEQGKLRSELTFRRPKPKIPWKWIGIGGALLAILIAVMAIAESLGGGGDTGNIAKDVPMSSTPPSMTTETTKSAGESRSARPIPSPTPTPRATTHAAITDVTVDDLLDMLNSAEMGGIKTGDQFRLTGELSGAESWGTGVTGDFSVYLKADGGAQDLMVFVDEAEAADWDDGTELQMIVESVEVTIDGEATGGWLRAQSAEILP